MRKVKIMSLHQENIFLASEIIDVGTTQCVRTKKPL